MELKLSMAIFLSHCQSRESKQSSNLSRDKKCAECGKGNDLTACYSNAKSKELRSHVFFRKGRLMTSNFNLTFKLFSKQKRNVIMKYSD